MRLILMGCEWTGKRTLAEKICTWWKEQTGNPTKFHDHFTPPIKVQDNPTTDAARENEQVRNLVPSLMEKFQRYQTEYHIAPFLHDDDMLAINLHYGDAVYAPLYLGYGRPGEFGDRRRNARWLDREMRELFPDTVLAMMKASPETVRRRMRVDPREGCPIIEKDVELVLSRFEEEYGYSLIVRRITLDTTNATAEESMKEFVRQMMPLLSEKDMLRILTHRAPSQ